jgi:hypothetical protein
MRSILLFAVSCAFGTSLIVFAFTRPNKTAASQAQTVTGSDPAKILVERLDLERYKATIRGLTQFGDRRQGTDRNRQAIDWIEAQLISYGCANIERLQYNYKPPSPDTSSTQANTSGGPGTWTPRAAIAVGGGRPRGLRVPTGVNNDPNAQPDPKFSQLNSQPSSPGFAKKSTARRLASHTPTRCASSAPTWTASAGARPPTTMDRAQLS